MQIRIISFLLILILSSCGKKKTDNVSAYIFYDSVNHELTATKDIQQRLIDRLLNIILLIDNDPNSSIDFQTVQELLDTAEASNITRIKNITAIKEFDEKIDYKHKVLDYLKHLDSFYDIEVKDFLNKLRNKTSDDVTEAKKMLQPALIAIKQKELIMKDTQEEFNNKYKKNTSGSRLVSPDYESVSLSSLKFEKVTIADGTIIDLISYSGGDCEGTSLVEYVQFIGINQSSGDTVRILALCHAQQYDLNKAPRSGAFKNFLPIDSNTVADNIVVIFNKNLEEIERKEYKTAFGILEFN